MTIINSVTIHGIVKDDPFIITRPHGGDNKCFDLEIDTSFDDAGQIQERIAYVSCRYDGEHEIVAGDEIVITGEFTVSKNKTTGKTYPVVKAHKILFLDVLDA